MPGAARNVGAKAASGQLLAFLDSDDLWAADKLRLQIDLHAGTSVEISHTRELWLRDGRTISQKSQKHRREGYVFADAVVKCTIGPSTAMIDRQLFLDSGGFREDLDFAEDYEFWLRLVWNRQVAYVDEPLTVKRAGHADQLSARYGEMERIRLEALRELIEAETFAGEAATLAVEELVRKCRIYAAGARKHGRSGEAEKYEALGHDFAHRRR
jgi:glycosyltransferase involved in cell wall biosynthesis